jgi:hypothetical protein
MSLLSPWFLLGLLGVVIPLAIHLSHKDKAEKIVFSTIRFLKQTPKKMIFFQRIRQWLLLLARVGIITLLALAFGRPFMSGVVSELAGLPPQSVVILLDTSMSMGYGDAFERGKKAALEVMESLHPGDEAAIVTFADNTGQVKALTTDVAELAAFVRHLDAPGFQPTRYLPALRLADQMLHSARYEDKTVYLISDYRRRAFDNHDTAWRLSPGVRFKALRVGDEETTNLAVTDVKSPTRLIRDQDEHVILGRVQNLGTRALSGAQVSLIIEGETVDTTHIDLTNRSEAVVEFRTVFRKRGVHRGAVTVVDDAFPPDNTFHLTVHVFRPIRILGVTGGLEANGYRDETTWFASAIGKPGRSLFQLDVVRPDTLTTEAMGLYKVIVLLNVGSLPEVHMRAIRSHMERGGSLLLAPADRVEAQTFNRLFRGLTPAILGEKRVHRGDDFLVVVEVNHRHPMIKALRINQNIDFGTAHFRGFWSTTPITGSEVIMRFNNGEAALLELAVGQGRVLLFTSSLDTTWNDFPLQGLYVPLMHETLRYLASQEDKKRAYTVGESVPLIVPSGNALRVSGPHGRETILTATAGNYVFYKQTYVPGFYGMRGGNLEDFFAVNVSAEESDLSPIVPSEIGDIFVNRETKPQPSRDARVSIRNAQLEQSQQFWWWIILLVFLLGLGETLLANRTYR